MLSNLALRRGRRGARLPGRVRLARRERAPPAAAAGARLRRRAAVPARLGDDRQPGRARRGAARRRGDGGRRRRGAASGADDRALEPAARGRGARPAGERPRRSVPAHGRARRARPADDRFGKSRKAASSWSTASPSERLDDRELARRLSPYRAGYTPAQRREIERRLVEGELLGVCATDALELGIDVGLLDACISVGFPGTVASLRQQWGRAGRRGHGLAVLVASEDALDQYFMREPEALLGRRVEAAILDHANPRVLDGHVRAAAFEAPLDDADREILGDEALERAAVLPELEGDAARLRLGRPRLPGRAGLAPLRDARRVHRRRHGQRRRARHRRARARVLDRARGRRLPPHGGGLPRAGARPRRADGARRALPRRLVHAGEEGDDDGDRREAPRRSGGSGSSSRSAESR